LLQGYALATLPSATCTRHDLSTGCSISSLLYSTVPGHNVG
jgi:hypothetical protein